MKRIYSAPQVKSRTIVHLRMITTYRGIKGRGDFDDNAGNAADQNNNSPIW